jgi:hypothetical protein
MAMGETRYRTRRQWHNVTMVLWVAPFAVLVGVIIAMSSGRFMPLITILLLFTVALVVALLRDRTRTCTYRIEGDMVSLTNGVETVQIAMAEITDASLIDRIGAREYLRQRYQHKARSRREWLAFAAHTTRFCTVDIGLTTFTLGIGRTVIDRMPDARHDLVLLRLRNGEVLLLSPEYGQDFADTLGRRLAGL